jgi:GSH-dependent disulfide-bond oxidoreductase
MLEEAGIPYNVKYVNIGADVNIGAGDQFKPDFLKISPNNRMPAIVDDGPRAWRAYLDSRERRHSRVPSR